MEDLRQSKINVAFASVLSELTNPINDKTNPHFKKNYVTLEGLLSHIKPVLAKNNLSFTTPPIVTDGGAGVSLILMYRDGEKTEEKIFDPLILPISRPSAQDIGSALTYARRYMICSVFSIAGEEDDDGTKANNAAPKSNNQKKYNQEQQKSEPKPDSGQPKMISKQQGDKMIELAEGDIDLIKKILANRNIKNAKHVPAAMFDELCSEIIQEMAPPF